MLLLITSLPLTSSPIKLGIKLNRLGLHTHLCNWVLDFLTNRPQTVCMGNHASTSITLSTRAPQGCVLSPLQYSLFTKHCKPPHNSHIIKFADDTSVIGLISNSLQERSLKSGVLEPRQPPHPELQKDKELILDFRRWKHKGHLSINISDERVEVVQSFQFLGFTLARTCHELLMDIKGFQRLNFL